MKTFFKKSIALTLTLLMLITSIPVMNLAGVDLGFTAEAATITSYSKGDIVEFGWYPQSKVTDSATITALNNKAPAWDNWTSYGYYSGTGDYGTMNQGDWMRYTDIMYNGNKYRGVKFTQYRPYYTYSLSSNTYQDDNGYRTNTVYWFKFESIDWRVLDPATGLVMCETIIDSQPYSNTIYNGGGRYNYFNDSSYSNYASDYETSSIRQWLNTDFYNTAFSSAQQKIVKSTTLNNDGYHTSVGTTGCEKLDSNPTSDKIFLLSYNEARSSNYGFNSSSLAYDSARFAQGSDYAQSQGLYVYRSSGSPDNNNSHWLLRSPGDYSNCCCSVSYGGNSISCSYFCIVGSSDYGVRPALNFNLSSGIFQSDVKDTGNSSANGAGSGSTNKEVTTGYKREHVVDNWKALNQSYKSEYLAGFAVPMDGTNGNPDYLIPGQSENMIPQGLAYWPEKDWVLVSSYDKNEENPSAIFALDRETGAFVAQFNLKKENGKDWKPHAGGIGVSEHNLYITCDRGVAYFPLSDLDVPSGTVKDITRADYMIVPYLYNVDEPDETAYTAYVSVSDGMLWTGNFYSNSTASQVLGGLLILPKNWYWEATEDSDSLIVGYKLSGESSKEEWTNLENSSHAAKHIITVDDSIDCIQGIAFKKMGENTYKMYLSRTTDESFSASITSATVNLNSKNIELKENKFSYYKNLPGTEGMVFIGDDLYILYESGSLSNCDDLASQVAWHQYFKDCTDVIWKVNESDLLQIPQVNSSWFENGAYSGYNHELSQFCADYCVLGYKYNKNEIKYYLNESGFTWVNGNMNAARDEVNYFIACKDIIVNGQSQKLFFVGCIGSYKNQWYSNFDPWSVAAESYYADLNEMDHTHHGFANARDYVYMKLEDYVIEKNIDTSDAIILFTGHSRGSATINLLAAKLIDNNVEDKLNFDANNIYSYGFATPNTTLTINGTMFNKYNSIINIVNPEDLVTKLLPTDWGYSRYGITYTLPSKTNVTKSYYNNILKKVQKYTVLNGLKEPYEPFDQGEVAVQNIVEDMTNSLSNIDDFYNKRDIYTSTSTYEYFRDRLLPFVTNESAWTDFIAIGATTAKFFTFQRAITGFFIDHQAIEPEFENAHLMETYAAYVKTMSKAQITAEERTSNKGTVNCPVDIEIYDKETGELVGRIVDNIVDEEIAAGENAVVMTVDGDSKSFWLPSNGDYEIKLIGNDKGLMDYAMSEIDSDIGEVKRVNFFDVEITDGLTMTADVEAEEFIIEEHELTFENGETLEPTEIFVDEDIETYNINITVSEGGSASSSQTAKSGDYVSLDAIAEEGWKFAGWYENSELISTETTLAFVAKSDRSLEAKFEHVDHRFGEWYEILPAACETIGKEQRDCSECDYSETQEMPAVEHNYEAVITPATCYSNGFTTNTCTKCGNGYTSNITAMLTHNFSDWYTVTDVTCETSGTEQRDCSECDYFETQVIPAIGHDFDGSECKNCDYDKADDCGCNCHKGGIAGFFFKIILFFQKIFKSNKDCKCGKLHY